MAKDQVVNIYTGIHYVFGVAHNTWNVVKAARFINFLRAAHKKNGKQAAELLDVI